MFQFKQFAIDDSHCGMKLGTDSVALGAWTDAAGCRCAIDMGGGCGILSLMLAQRFTDLYIDAVEIDPDACDDCRHNFAQSPWQDRMTVHCCGFDEYQPAEAPDLIISNPPYFTTGMRSPGASRATARHESAMTTAEIVNYAARWLSCNGSLALILPTERADDCIFDAELAGLKLRRRCDISHTADRPAIRSLLQLSRRDGVIEKSCLAVRSKTFAALTADFYL